MSSGYEIRVTISPCAPLQDILDGGNLRSALQELQQIIITPIKAYSPPVTARKEAEPKATSSEKSSKSSEDKDAAAEGFQSNNPPACDGESTVAPISDGDIAGQFTRVMGKGGSQDIIDCIVMSPLCSLFPVKLSAIIFKGKFFFFFFLLSFFHSLNYLGNYMRAWLFGDLARGKIIMASLNICLCFLLQKMLVIFMLF